MPIDIVQGNNAEIIIHILDLPPEHSLAKEPPAIKLFPFFYNAMVHQYLGETGKQVFCEPVETEAFGNAIEFFVDGVFRNSSPLVCRQKNTCCPIFHGQPCFAMESGKAACPSLASLSNTTESPPPTHQ